MFVSPQAELVRGQKKKPLFPHPPLDLQISSFTFVWEDCFLEYQTMPDTLAGEPWGSLVHPTLVFWEACRKESLLPFFLSS